MTNGSSKHRRSIRLPEYDYSGEGAYFVTLCTYHRACTFGEIVDGEMKLNGLGLIVKDEWLRTAQMRPNMDMGSFVVMPNHFHGIITIKWKGALTSGRTDQPIGQIPLSKANSISAVVRGFKSAVTRCVNEGSILTVEPVWQPNYYERIIRDDTEMDRINEYIVMNPERWAEDEEYRG